MNTRFTSNFILGLSVIGIFHMVTKQRIESMLQSKGAPLTMCFSFLSESLKSSHRCGTYIEQTLGYFNALI